MKAGLFSLASVACAGELPSARLPLPRRGRFLEDTVVPTCRPGFQDITGGKAYPWSCAFHCVGGPNFATESCGCACLSQDQIDDLASGTPATTVRAVGQAGELLVTEPPTPDLFGQIPVQEVPVGDVQDGQVAERPPDNDNFVSQEAPITTTTLPAPEESVGLSQVAILLLGFLFLFVAFWTAMLFAYRQGMLPCKPKPCKDSADLSIHVSIEEPPEPGIASRAGPRMSLASRDSSANAEPPTPGARRGSNALFEPAGPMTRQLSEQSRRSSLASAVSRTSTGSKVPPRRSRTLSRQAREATRKMEQEEDEESDIAPPPADGPTEAWGPQMEIVTKVNSTPIWIQAAQIDAPEPAHLCPIRRPSRAQSASRRKSADRTQAHHEAPMARARAGSLLSVNSMKASRVHPIP